MIAIIILSILASALVMKASMNPLGIFFAMATLCIMTIISPALALGVLVLKIYSEVAYGQHKIR